MAQPKRHHVDFVATKRVKRPTEVAFRTKTGRKVDFVARKPVDKRVKISFMARNKNK